MVKKVSLRHPFFTFGIPLFITLFLVFLAKSTWFDTNHKSISTGIMIDLLIVVPIVYFALIRKTKIPKITLIPLFFLGVFTASKIIPEDHQYSLIIIKNWMVPVLELFVLGFITTKVVKGIREYKKNKKTSPDFFSTLKNTCRELFPSKIASLLAMEIAVFYYGFIYWKKRMPQKNEFTYHKNSSVISLLAALLIIIAAETLVLHFALAKWNTIVAWILTVLSIYSGIQIFGFLKSISKRPVLIENEVLKLRYGIMSEAIINIEDIDAVVISSKEMEFKNRTVKLSPLGEMESHNIVLYLKKEQLLN